MHGSSHRFPFAKPVESLRCCSVIARLRVFIALLPLSHVTIPGRKKKERKTDTQKVGLDREPQARPVGLAACSAGSWPKLSEQTKKEAERTGKEYASGEESEKKAPRHGRNALTEIHKLDQWAWQLASQGRSRHRKNNQIMNA